MQRSGYTLGFLFLALCGCAGPAKPSPSSPPGDTKGGEGLHEVTATSAQISRGQELFGQHCGGCHGASGEGGGAPKLVGSGALPRTPPGGDAQRTGEFATVHDVYTFVRATMPPADPSVLSDADVWAILAFDLKANGLELEEPLSPALAKNLPLD